MSMIRNAAAATLVLLTSPAFAQTARPQGGPITCASPIARDDPETSLKLRFGKEAVVQDLADAEGETHKGLVLFPNAADRRIEVSFSEDNARRVSPGPARHRRDQPLERQWRHDRLQPS